MPAPLAPFTETVVSAVAETTDFGTKELRSLLERHQEYVRGYETVGGVDGLVYEWRQSLFDDPLAVQDTETYYLAVPERVWVDFGERLGFSNAELAALRAVHDRQFRAAHGDPDGAALVLSKA